MNQANSKDALALDFQSVAGEMLARNRSVLDILSKMIDSNAKINRSVTKATTHCGCTAINASKPNFPEDATLETLSKYTSGHIHGELCPQCKDKIEDAIGQNLFYIASICNNLNIDLYEVMQKEKNRLMTIGKYNMR